ncbi:MAG: FAD-dependent oxidoreductase [Nitriliruptorales bacterium]|nr:FAD-dependent oxidoreductase [Nitriliruptorales bacterium]
MATTIIIGDGPAGLSAALFLAKNDHEAVVFGQDDTAMHWALLKNYLGIDEQPGSEFQERAKDQVKQFGADLRDEEVTEVRRDADGFVVTTAGGGQERGDYLVLAAGKAGGQLAEQLDIEAGPDGVAHDTEYRTSVDRVYAIGRLARPNRSQAIVSAGAGATAALDILSREAGEDVHDWDSPDD